MVKKPFAGPKSIGLAAVESGVELELMLLFALPLLRVEERRVVAVEACEAA